MSAGGHQKSYMQTITIALLLIAQYPNSGQVNALQCVCSKEQNILWRRMTLPRVPVWVTPAGAGHVKATAHEVAQR